MTADERRLVLLCARFQHAVDAAETRWAVAAELDGLFDGGEFSGPACARCLEIETHQLARRFGFRDAEAAHATARMVNAVVAPAPEWPPTLPE